MFLQLILSRIRSISKSHVVHPGLDAFRVSPPPRPPKVKKEPVEITEAAPVEEVPAPETQEGTEAPPAERKSESVEPLSPLEEDVPLSTLMADASKEKEAGPAEETAAATAAPAEEEEDEDDDPWIVQPADVPGLKESGWTREMDEMYVVP